MVGFHVRDDSIPVRGEQETLRRHAPKIRQALIKPVQERGTTTPTKIQTNKSGKGTERIPKEIVLNGDWPAILYTHRWHID